MATMPEWLPYLIVTVILMIGSFLVWLGSKLLPQIRKGTRVLDDFLGEPARPGVAARPGAIEVLAGALKDVTVAAGQTRVIRQLVTLPLSSSADFNVSVGRISGGDLVVSNVALQPV